MFLVPASPCRLPATAQSLLPFPSLSTACRRAAVTVGCLAALLVAPLARAQTPGEQDTSFTSILSGATLFALTLQDINGTTRIFSAGDTDADARLIADGTYDLTFGLDDFGNETGRTIYTSVQELVLQDTNSTATSAPKLLLGGLFGRSQPQIAANDPAQNIIRVNLDGSTDTSFNPGKGSDNYITAILPLADGGMVVGGEFLLFNNITHVRIARLDNTGAIVPSSVFDPKLAFDNTILSLATQVNPDAAGPQGQILVAGIFANVNGQPYHDLVRLNADGTVDNSFKPNFSDRVVVVTCQPDGKILAGGDFQSVNGVAENHLVRLNYDGSVDTTFNAQVSTQPAGTAATPAVNTITPLGDGRYYIGGNFAQINGVNRAYLGRVLADGTVDDFDPGTAIINVVQQVAVDPFTNRVYVTETRSKSITDSSGTKTYPASLIRLFGDPVPTPQVTVTAPFPKATIISPGQFLFSRTALDLRGTLTAYFTLGGNAVLRVAGETTAAHKPIGQFVFGSAPIADANSIDGAATFIVTFPVNATTVAVNVDTAGKGTKNRILEVILQPDQTGKGTYQAANPNTATVKINRK